MYKFKQTILPILICLFIVLLLVFSSSNISATKSGLALWANSVLPSLLPFFIATELLSYTNVVYFLGNIFKKIMKPLFNVSGEGAFPFIMGIISGYPIGAKIIANLKAQSALTNVECERLIAFTNNSSLLFILGTVGITLFGNSKIGVLLLTTHLLSCLSVGFIFRWWKYNSKNDIEINVENKIKSTQLVCFSNLGEILSNSIFTAINTCFIIGGFIVFFSVLISMIENLIVFPNAYIESIFIGLLELTHGVQKISLFPVDNLSLVLCSFVLGFGGVSVLLQVFSITSKAKISIKPYIIGKMLQGILAAFYTLIFLITF